MSISETLLGGRYAYFDAAVSLPFLLLIGRYLDHYLRRKARATARDWSSMQSVTATRMAPDGRTEASRRATSRPATACSSPRAIAHRSMASIEEGASEVDHFAGDRRELAVSREAG